MEGIAAAVAAAAAENRLIREALMLIEQFETAGAWLLGCDIGG